MFFKRQRPVPRIAHNRGFSLFELVVFILTVSIIYAAAARRFAEFPGEAERANFLSTVNQIQVGINLELFLYLTRGQAAQLHELVGVNPMELLLEPPSNYLGAFSDPAGRQLDRRSWYFDLVRKELVYLINDNSDVNVLIDGAREPTDELRFAVRLAYRNPSEQDAPETAGTIVSKTPSGALFEPVLPFEWNTEILDSVAADIAQN